MARPLFVLDEVLAMLDVVGAPESLVAKFRSQAEMVLAHKVRRSTRDDGADTITVGSGYGTVSKRGHVELLVNDEVIQMDTAKAREVGLMLIEAAEAATSDEIVMTLLRERIGLTDTQQMGRMLMDLREIRQGTRGIAWPS